MLTKEEREAKCQELGGDCLAFTGPHPTGGKWTVILGAPELKDVEYYLANRNNDATRALALHILVRSMVRFVDPVAAKYNPGEVPGAKADYDHLRARATFISEGIGKTGRFDRFVGLEVDEEEKG